MEVDTSPKPWKESNTSTFQSSISTSTNFSSPIRNPFTHVAPHVNSESNGTWSFKIPWSRHAAGSGGRHTSERRSVAHWSAPNGCLFWPPKVKIDQSITGDDTCWASWVCVYLFCQSSLTLKSIRDALELITALKEAVLIWFPCLSDCPPWSYHGYLYCQCGYD